MKPATQPEVNVHMPPSTLVCLRIPKPYLKKIKGVETLKFEVPVYFVSKKGTSCFWIRGQIYGNRQTMVFDGA